MAEIRPPDTSRIIKQNSNKRYNTIGDKPEPDANLSGHLSVGPACLSIEEETAIARLAQLFAMRDLVGNVLRLLLRITKASGTEGAKAVRADGGDYRLLLMAAIAEVRARNPGKR